MRKALGRGLETLIPTTAKTAATHVERGQSERKNQARVPIHKVRPNHLQPRRHFHPEKLNELAESIKEHGIAQPILVSYDESSDTYELIAGERRLRAAELAGLKEVEIIIKNPRSEQERLALSIIENVQRQDLNPIEEALGYQRMIEEFGFSQTDMAKAIGKSKAAMSNTLRLLELSSTMRQALETGELTEGHARTLLMVADPIERERLFQTILKEKISVRQSEELARNQRAKEESKKKAPAEKPADIRSLEASLQHGLGTKVEIRANKDQSRGRISIHFYSLEDFDRILKIIKK